MMAASNRPHDLNKLSGDIDNLIQRYLHLSHQYHTLRSQLNNTQYSLYQNLSRANLAPDRGIASYGADRYDERMQASRLCRITEEKDELQGSTSLPGLSWRLDIEEERKEGSKDPISMFAILPPQSLRAAQKDALGMMSIIPRILELQSEMAEIEIRVRRGRKYLAKFQDEEYVDDTKEEVEKVAAAKSKDMTKELGALDGSPQPSQGITG